MDVIMPQLGETVAEGTVSIWHKKVGDDVKEGEALFDASTDKVEMEIPAPASGTLRRILVPAGESVAVGTRLAIIGDLGTPAESNTPAAPPVSEEAATLRPSRARTEIEKRDSRGIALSPVVRRLFAEHGLDPEAIDGTGPRGRITRQDVQRHLESRADGAMGAKESVRVPFDRLRRLTAEHMVRSKATSPHVLQAVEVDFSAVEQARSSAPGAWKAKEGFSLTYLPFVAFAVCQALRAFPRLNALVEGDSLLQLKRVNLGIAVDLARENLVVPVIADAGTKSLVDLARDIHILSSDARGRRLDADRMRGGTYTISNSGGFGTLITAPIIHQPQVAILSLDGVKRKPVVVSGVEGEEIAIRPIGVLAQSFDHRAVDGAYSAAFLAKLREIIEMRDWARDLA
ncbi:MAG: dihydrolipoamide acetyltransferase family protein [Kiloniellales bacterium]